MILSLVNFVNEMRIALSELDVIQRLFLHLGNTKKYLCNSNWQKSSDYLESGLNMVTLQNFQTNILMAFFSYETITTLLIGIFTLKCSKSRGFHSQYFDISFSIFNAAFFRCSFVKWGFQLIMQQVIDASSLYSVGFLNLFNFNSATHENLT